MGARWGSVSTRGDSSFCCGCHECSPELHRSYVQRGGVTKQLDDGVTCRSGAVPDTTLYVHGVICESNGCFLKLPSVLLGSGDWLALMVSPRSLSFDYSILLSVSLQPSCSIAGCLQHFIFLYFFFLKTVTFKTAVSDSHCFLH